MKGLLIALLVVFGMFLVSFIINLCLSSKNKKLKSDIKRREEAYEGAVRELQLLMEAQKIKNKNEEEADEKINNLYNGDVVANAINGLCKH